MGFEWQPSTNCRIFSRTPPWRHLEGHRHWALGCETSIPETQNPKNWDILWYLVISYILWYLMISWSEDISRSWNSSGYPADPAPASPPFWRSRFLELGHLWHVPIGSRPPEMPKKSLLVSKKNRWSKICKHRFTYIYLHFTTKLAIDLPPN